VKLIYLVIAIFLSVASFGESLQKATSRSDAEIYASASLVGAQNAQTIYAFDLKYAYRTFKHHIGPPDSKWYFQARPLLEFVTNKGTRASPDKVNLGGEVGLFRQLTRNRSAKGFERLKATSFEIVANPRGEFDRKFDTRNFVTASFGRFIFPNVPPMHPGLVNLSPLAEIGFENGQNYSNGLQKVGSGRIGRVYASVDAVFWYCSRSASGTRDDCDSLNSTGIKGSSLELSYQYRGPLRDEIFTTKLDKPQVLYLSSKPRHYFNAALRIPIFGFFAIKPEYKWGSLPPAYVFLQHQYTLTVDIAAKHK